MKLTERETKIYDDLMLVANCFYAEAKGGWDEYSAPETLPKINSDQVKSLAKAVAQLIGVVA